MKLSTFAARLAPALPYLACPLCGGALSLAKASLVCPGGHCFDLSAKGYVNLAPAHNQTADKYGAALFDNRRRVFDAGFYRPVLEAVRSLLSVTRPGGAFSLLDVGCGEGYYARSLSAAFPAATVLGADLSREAIVRAARGGGTARWLVADLKRLPVRDAVVDVILDVLTPADYAEFGRVLAPGGELLKLAPGADHLCEIRAMLAGRLRNETYDNARVLSRLECRAEVLERRTVRKTFPVQPEQSDWLLRMTPMTFSVPEEALQGLSLKEITIHMELLRCRLYAESGQA